MVEKPALEEDSGWRYTATRRRTLRRKECRLHHSQQISYMRAEVWILSLKLFGTSLKEYSNWKELNFTANLTLIINIIMIIIPQIKQKYIVCILWIVGIALQQSLYVNGFKVAESVFPFEKRLLQWKECVCIVSLNFHRYYRIMVVCSFYYLFTKTFQVKTGEII